MHSFINDLCTHDRLKFYVPLPRCIIEKNYLDKFTLNKLGNILPWLNIEHAIMC